MEKRIVNLTPTPSPELSPPVVKQSSPEAVARPSTSGRPKRRRTKASQGDAVLVGYMANQNNPEVAAKAGEEALNSASEVSDSDADDSYPSTVSEAEGVLDARRKDDLGEIAPPAHLHRSGYQRPTEDRADRSKEDGAKPALPSLLTRDLGHPITPVGMFDAVQTRSGSDGSDDRRSLYGNGIHQASTRVQNIPPTSTRLASPIANRPSQVLRRQSSGNSTLRKFAMPASEASHTETLPAMQNTPSARSAHSPQEQPTLPPLQGLLSDLDHARRPNGLSPAPGTMHSQSGPFTSPPSRMNNQFLPPYPPVQLRPLAHGDSPPRGSYRPTPNVVAISPTAHLGGSSYYSSNRRTHPNEDMAMAPAESYRDPGRYGSEASPSGDRLSMESTRAVLQPPQGVLPAPTGSFRCEYSDCKAQPFQTQYLLK